MCLCSRCIFSRFVWISCTWRDLQQSQVFGRQRTWGFLPFEVFLGYPLAIWGKPIKATPFEEPYQN
uniref:Uncharacterized protein n=1 Tax=Fagus sylvatica TaxID=28930 RepID=A0A2N9INZ0_FAGSY